MNLPPKLRESLNAVQTTGPRVERLNRLQEPLAAGKRVVLGREDVNVLPPPLKQGFEELAHLEHLEAGLTTKWSGQPDLAEIEQGLSQLAFVRKDPNPVRKVRVALVLKAADEGHEDVARRLLPADLQTEDFPAVLRDLKAASAAAKSAPTATSQPALPAEPLLIPEGTAGTRPAVKERVAAGLPPLEEVTTVTQQTRRRLLDRVAAELETQSHHFHLHLHCIHDFSQQAQTAAREDQPLAEPSNEKPEAAVARLLGRSITPTERILISGMLARGKKPAEIAAELRTLDSISGSR